MCDPTHAAFPRRRILAALTIAILGVGCEPAIPNPSGGCKAPNDGARAGYHAPAGSQWLPDCQNPLRREYWRVFAWSETKAYTIPRLDGHPLLQPACADPQHQLAELVQRYALCSSATTPQQVEQINSMLPAHALELTRFLHHQLRFAVAVGGTGISPPPISTDVIDACDLRRQSSSAELTAICDRERARLKSGHDIAFSYTGPGAVELVERLNELYGIM